METKKSSVMAFVGLWVGDGHFLVLFMNSFRGRGSMKELSNYCQVMRVKGMLSVFI